MKKKEIIKAIAVITIAATIVGVYAYNTEYSKENNEIKVMDYKAPEVVNEKGYEISKCEADNIKQWVDKDKVITLRNDLDDKEHYDSNAVYISMYDLDTKTYKDYKNSIIYDYAYYGEGYRSVSPGGKYVLYIDEKMHDDDSEEDKDGLESSAHVKMNILDLSTGEIIRDFDKGQTYLSDSRCLFASRYKWINDDYIFALMGSKWMILDKEGKVIKEGEIDNKDDNSSVAFLMDISEIKVQDNDFVGSFYYQCVKKGNTDVFEEVYSVDINTKEQKCVGKYDGYKHIAKKGSVISVGDFPKRGNEPTSYGFKLMDVSGREIQSYEGNEKRYGGVLLSDDGERCAFLDFYGDKNGNEGLFDAVIKVMDVKSGETKEITKVRNLVDGMDNVETMEGIKELSYDMVWDRTGTSLAFSSSFRITEDRETHKSSYIITFDK